MRRPLLVPLALLTLLWAGSCNTASSTNSGASTTPVVNDSTPAPQENEYALFATKDTLVIDSLRSLYQDKGINFDSLVIAHDALYLQPHVRQLLEAGMQ